jgi:hypothetical protein
MRKKKQTSFSAPNSLLIAILSAGAMVLAMILCFGVSRDFMLNIAKKFLGSVSKIETHDPLQFVFLEGICTPRLERKSSIQYSSKGESLPFGQASNLGSPAGNRFEAEVRGTLFEFCIESNANAAIISYRFLPELISFGGATSDATSSNPTQRFVGEIFAKYNSEGKVTEIIFPQSYSQNERNSFRDILVNRTLSIPKNEVPKDLKGDLAARFLKELRSDANWETLESDPNGDFTVTYRVGKLTENIHKISKNRKSYLKVDALGQKRSDLTPVEKIIDPSSFASFILESGERKTFIETRKDLKSFLKMTLKADGKVLGVFETNYSEVALESKLMEGTIQHDPLKQSHENFDLAVASGVKSDLLASDSSKNVERRMQEQELGGSTKQDLFLRLENIHGNRHAETKLYLQLKALLILDPKSSADLANMLLQKNRHEKAFQVGVLALVKVGSPETQKAYLDLLQFNKSKPEETRFLIAMAGFIEDPGSAIVEEVLLAAKSSQDAETQSASTLALGNLGRSLLSNSKNSQAQELESVLINALSSASSIQETVSALDGLGNLGSGNAVKEALKFAHHNNSKIREAAASALRFSDGEAFVQQELLRIVSEDSESHVRDAAVRSLGTQNLLPETEAFLVTHVAQEKVESVRLSLLDLLAKVETRRNRIRPTLTSVMQNDPSPRVRAQAELWLSQSH